MSHHGTQPKVGLEEAPKHPLYGAVKQLREGDRQLSIAVDHGLSEDERATLASARAILEGLQQRVLARWRTLSGYDPEA